MCIQNSPNRMCLEIARYLVSIILHVYGDRSLELRKRLDIVAEQCFLIRVRLFRDDKAFYELLLALVSKTRIK